MYDFVFAALPWIAMGITVAIVLVNINNKKKVRYLSNEKFENIADENTDKRNAEANVVTLWMILGMSFGIAIGSSLMDTFGTVALTYGICFGMLIGTLIGVFLKKK